MNCFVESLYQFTKISAYITLVWQPNLSIYTDFITIPALNKPYQYGFHYIFLSLHKGSLSNTLIQRLVTLDTAPPKVPFIQNLLFPVGIDGNNKTLLRVYLVVYSEKAKS